MLVTHALAGGRAAAVMEGLERRELFTAAALTHSAKALIHSAEPSQILPLSTTPAQPPPGDYKDGSGNEIKIEDSDFGSRIELTIDTGFRGATRKTVVSFYSYGDFQKIENGDSPVRYVLKLPAAAGGGTITITLNPKKSPTASIFGTLNSGVFYPEDVALDGLNFTTSATTQSLHATSLSVQKTAAVTVSPSLARNPLLGNFRGTVRRTSDQKVYKYSASFSLNKKGHIAIEADITIPGFGDVVYDSVVHPSSKGSFSLLLGDINSPADLQTLGTLSGHISHTGRLVLRLSVPNLSVETGSLKRKG